MIAMDKDFTAQYSTGLADFHMFTYCDTTSALKCQNCFSTFIVLFIRCKGVHIAVIMHVCIQSCCSEIRRPFTNLLHI